MPKRPSVASTVMQVVTGSKPISELVSDFGEMCGEGWRAAGIRHLAVMLLGPCLWVVWCVFAMHLREYASEEYPLLADATVWLCLVVGFAAVPLIASMVYLSKCPVACLVAVSDVYHLQTSTPIWGRFSSQMATWRCRYQHQLKAPA